METTEVLVYEITESVHDITDGTVNVPEGIVQQIITQGDIKLR